VRVVTARMHAELLALACESLRQPPEGCLSGGGWRAAPVTARRFHALAARLGDDDMFSSDLTPAELQVRFKRSLPLALCEPRRVVLAWSMRALS